MKKNNQAKVLIVDYGMGNIKSIQNALIRLGCLVQTSARAEDILSADAIILPGVGAFGEAMANIEARNIALPLSKAVKKKGTPLLGICLGMQLLADTSEEGGRTKGLSLIPGDVRRIQVEKNFRLPHIGWNSIKLYQPTPLFEGIREGDSFYFVHSYHFVGKSENIVATTDHGSEIVASVQHENVFGVQFHPERSQHKGFVLLKNFISYVHENNT
jgi:imidazole glycerol-phosphate synthase subunit HisH